MSCPVSPISSINSIAPHSRPHSPCVHQFPPASALYQLAGKSNFQLWLSAIKPYLFSNPESTGLILGGWTEPKASNDAVGTTWTRERWIAANTETCRFIRGTLAMNVIPHVRQHNTAKGLWHNLLWLYGEEAGIDTQGGPPVPRGGDDVYGSQRGGGGGGGGGGGRAKLLAAMAKKTTSIEHDLDPEMGRGDKVVSPLHSPPLMPVIKASGSGASSHSFGPFLEVPSFDGPEDEDEDEDDYEDEDYESDDEFSRIPPQFILAYNTRSQTTSSATSATTTAAPTTLKHFTINKGMSDEVVDHHPATTSHNPLRNRGKPSSSASSSSSSPGASLDTIQEESHHDPHPGRRVDLSDSSVLIRRRSIFDAIPYLSTRDDRRASSSDDADAFDGHSVNRRKRGGIVFQRWFNTSKRASGGGGGGGDANGRDRLSLSSPVLLRRLNVGGGGGAAGGSRDRKRDGVADWKGKGKAVQM